LFCVVFLTQLRCVITLFVLHCESCFMLMCYMVRLLEYQQEVVKCLGNSDYMKAISVRIVKALAALVALEKSRYKIFNNNKARQLLTDLGRRISESSGDARETSFLFQRISVPLYWCSVSMLSCYTTVCRFLTSRTDD